MWKKLSPFIPVFFTITIFLFPVISIPTVNASQEELEEILKESNQAVVSLSVLDSKKKEICQGKGVVVSSDGLVLTNYHLICQAHSIKAFLSTGEKIMKRVEWENVFYPGFERARSRKSEEKKTKGKWLNVSGVVGVDKNLDFALLKIDKKDCYSSPLSPSDELKIGDRVIIIVDDESITEGAITGTKNLLGTKKISQINIPLTPDMCGSPLFNPKGEVLGIATSIADKGILVLPAAYALPLVQEKKATPHSDLSPENYFTTSEGLYLKGIATLAAGDIQGALSLFENAQKANPDNPFVYSQIGFTSSRLKLHEKAIEAYREAVNMNPNDYESFFGLGMAYIRLNQPQQAISPFVQCTTINPQFPDAFYNLGLVYETLGQLEKSAEAYQQFIKINPGPAWTGFNQLGSVYIKMGQYEKAATAFQEVLKSNPSDLKATYQLANAYEMSGQYDLAAPLYKSLISLNPKDANVYQNLLFRLHDKAGQYDQAIEVGQEIISQSPNDPNNHYNLGIIYFKQQNYEKALETFQNALSNNPNFNPAYYNIGLVHFKQEKYAQAIEAFTRFTELKPDQPDAYYNIGVAYLQLKKYDEAIPPLQKTIELKPDYTLAHYNVGLAYYAVGDRYSADEEYKTLKSLDPDLAEKLRKIIQK